MKKMFMVGFILCGLTTSLLACYGCGVGSKSLMIGDYIKIATTDVNGSPGSGWITYGQIKRIYKNGNGCYSYVYRTYEYTMGWMYRMVEQMPEGYGVTITKVTKKEYDDWLNGFPD